MRYTKQILVALLAVILPCMPCLAGAVGGPKVQATDVQACSSDEYHINFFANEDAIIRVDGDGDTVLHVTVYDQNGNLVAADTDNDGTGFALVQWTPRWTGTFTVHVENHGSVYNNYTIVTN